jgi:hypothetical protein
LAIFIGCAVHRVPDAAYARHFGFAELRLRTPVPRIPTLRRLGAGVPSGMQLALRAPQRCVVSSAGPLRRDAALQEALGWLDRAVTALGAGLVLVRTPVELMPGARGAALLREYAASVPAAQGRDWVWSAGGAWQPEDRDALAAELGWVAEFEPLLEEPPVGPVGYARIQCSGSSNPPESQVEHVLAALAGYERAYLVAEGPRAGSWARRFVEAAGA